jgi:hypothetical protein
MWTEPRRRVRGNISVLPSGSLRVKVYAGIDPVTGREHYLRKVISAGPNAAKEAEKARTDLLAQSTRSATHGPTRRSTNSSTDTSNYSAFSRPRMRITSRLPATTSGHSSATFRSARSTASYSIPSTRSCAPAVSDVAAASSLSIGPTASTSATSDASNTSAHRSLTAPYGRSTPF